MNENMNVDAKGSEGGDTCHEFNIVGVGASAGGLEALEALFAAMPTDTGMAFVVVQHLSPDFKSHMEELLGRRTTMPIHRVENGMNVEPNAIYLIPPKMEMVISDGSLLLTEKSVERTLSHPIDQFFRSLASDVGRYSVAVVLSGTGSDGSRGIRDIHDAGGLVIAQSEKSAKFDGMPMNAQSTGVVDLVLPPEGIADALVRYIKDGLSPDALARHELTTSSSEGAERIFELLQSQHGIDFAQYKGTTVGRRIQRRIELLNLDSIEDYIQHLLSVPEEINALYKDLLIGVTKFFRDPEAYEIVEKDVVPKLFKDSNNPKPIRVWIAGCASGEEAYSFAMLIDEEMRRRKIFTEIKVFATDVHHVSLHVAAKAVYPEEALTEISEARRSRYFQKKRDGYHIVPELRRHVIFAPHNVIGDAPFTQMDIVSCRNLLIYLQPSAQKKALSMFHFAIKAGGTLMLGPSETPGELSDEFETIDKRWRVYRKRRDVRLPLESPTQLGLASDRLPRAAVTPTTAANPRVDTTLLGTYDRLLDRKMPPSILVNERLEILHVFSGAERFIESRSGRRSNLLLDVLNEHLKTPLTGALQHAIRKEDVVKYTGIHVPTSSGNEESMQITVEPIHDPAAKVTNLLVEFEIVDQVRASATESSTVDVGEMSRERIAALESELRYSQENLQATIEEMETANEELQATNEELVASNEELQSTNEELHSVNEELYTVNAEHQKRVDELAQANGDMDNLLATTRVGVIYLDDELFIRRFTPEIARLLNLVPHDVGRSIESFLAHFNYTGLVDVIREVFTAEKEKELDIVSNSGTAYLLRMLPYRSSADVSGVVLTLIDVNRLKRTQAELERFKFMSESAVDMQVLLDSRGRFSYANPAFQASTGYTADDLSSMTVADVDVEFDIPRFRELFAALDEKELRPFESKLQHRDGSRIPVEISVGPVTFENQRFAYFSLRDVTERHESEQWLRLHKAAMDSAASGVIMTDYAQQDNPIIYVNSGFTQMTGYSAEDSVGRNCRFLQGEGTDGESIDKIRYAMTQGESCQVLLKNFRKDGTRFWNDLVVTPVKAPDGRVTHYVGIQNDVTARVEEASRMTAVLNTATEGIFGVDTSGNCVFCNASSLRLLGYDSEKEVLGRNMHELVHSRRRDDSVYPENESPLNLVFGSHETAHADDEVFWRKDGSHFEVEYWCEPMLLDGEIQGAVVTFLDITDRRKIDERVRRLGTLVDASQDAIIVWSKSRGIQNWNVGATKLYGFSSEDAAGKVTHELLQTKHPISFDEIWQTMDETGEWSGVIEHVSQDGRTVKISTRHQLWRQEGAEDLVFEVNRDVTEEHRIREEVEQAYASANQANVAKSEFLANMSHELRTPMTAVLGFAEMLGNELNDESQQEKIQTITRNGKYLLTLLNDILDLSKIEAGKMEVASEPIDVMQLIEDVRSLMHARAKDEGIPLAFEFPAVLPKRIRTDAIRIRQIIVNLVANALKFTDEGSVRVVTGVDVEGDSTRLRVDVIDTGIGMTPQQQAALFKPFTQATKETSQKFGGTGLGLSISKRLAERMKGSITLESELGQGSKFSLFLPVTAEEMQSTVDPRQNASQPQAEVLEDTANTLPQLSARVLLADDRRDVWRVVKFFLEKQGATVVIAEDGRQAVDEANRARNAGEPFDMILMDMQMPVMNGREAVTELRRQGFEVPIIALTANAMTGERQACIDFGCTEYIPKPVDGPELIRTVAQLLG